MCSVKLINVRSQLYLYDFTSKIPLRFLSIIHSLKGFKIVEHAMYVAILIGQALSYLTINTFTPQIERRPQGDRDNISYHCPIQQRNR